ncbi:hypothetical protein [Falsibacillus pallidus]|uniref:Choloylglycine hydrolase n=1 Tax=Falsibacillus pallidus TaxID=493781 RepID=A0A370GSL8_9BACI|nr:hypothetical protein [Falsibacillus pallidus]RDI45514.1 hypothetical protein DFR59_102142 [Falsibacillus pallidus]
MCTSFVLNAEKRFIGMNFDIGDRPIKFSHTNDGRLTIFQSDSGTFLPALGMNKNGAFMNLQMVEGREEGNYRRGKNVVHIIRLFDEVLSGKLDSINLAELLSEKNIVNVPGHSVHSLLCTNQRETFIVSPGREHMDAGGGKVQVLTNFPLSQSASNYSTSEPGMDRYQIVKNYLNEEENNFSIDKGFEVLEKACQSRGDYPTQLSLIFLPDEKELYFSIKRNFEDRFCFSFDKGLVSNVESDQSWKVGKKGLLLSDLMPESNF